MKNEEDISSDKTENQIQERSLRITTKGTNPRKKNNAVGPEIITQIG